MEQGFRQADFIVGRRAILAVAEPLGEPESGAT